MFAAMHRKMRPPIECPIITIRYYFSSKLKPERYVLTYLVAIFAISVRL